jgi:hypothetical protein
VVSLLPIIGVLASSISTAHGLRHLPLAFRAMMAKISCAQCVQLGLFKNLTIYLFNWFREAEKF